MNSRAQVDLTDTQSQPDRDLKIDSCVPRPLNKICTTSSRNVKTCTRICIAIA